MDQEGTCERCGAEMAEEHAFCRRCGTPRGQAATGPQEWTCMTCGRRVPIEFRHCPNCGRPAIVPYYPYQYPPPQPEYHEDPTILHFILYALSFTVPLLGFVLGALLHRSDNTPEDRHAGKICILLAFFWPILAVAFIIRLMLIV